jgi:hypothetical protein
MKIAWLRRRPVRIILVAAIVGLLAAASWGLWYELSPRQSKQGSGVVSDGPTFAQAFSAVNGSVGRLPGGPWTLSQAFGIATPIPSSPSSWGWPGDYPETMNACQPAFNGLTIWNGTLPLFNGTFNSGTAPFWQFVFFSNQSGQLLIGTDVVGEVAVYPPIGLSSACAVFSHLGYEPWTSAKLISRGLFPIDTPVMAEAAWGAVGKTWVDGLGEQLTEMYLIGNLPFGSGASPTTQLEYFTCGTLGGVGVTRGLSVFTDPYNPSDVAAWENYSLGCTPTANNWTAIPIHVDFANSTVTHGQEGGYYAQNFQVMSGSNVSDQSNQTLGITSWMVNLSLTSSSGGSLPLGTSGCNDWTRTYTNCLPYPSGWYAVLLSKSGEWMDSFGETTYQGAWSLSVVPIVSGQFIVVVVPNTWTLTNATLTVSSTTTGLPLTGNSVIP